MITYKCPKCLGPLKRVFRPSNSVLNEYQFNSIRVGDYYCIECKHKDSNYGGTGYLYFWEKELEQKYDKLQGLEE
jgi:hypothetical protein